MHTQLKDRKGNFIHDGDLVIDWSMDGCLARIRYITLWAAFWIEHWTDTVNGEPEFDLCEDFHEYINTNEVCEDLEVVKKEDIDFTILRKKMIGMEE
jgi:hypothetical protein